jgi:hypothetical protein
MFAGLVTIAVRLRRRTDVHKRLMLLTIACLLPDALARLPVHFMTNGLMLVGLYGFIVVCMVIDTIRQRRPHPAFGWGGLALLGAFTLLLFAATRPGWIEFATRMVS